MESKPSLGELIRDSRRSKGWSQKRLAKASRVPVRTIQEIESGRTKKPHDATLEDLAVALGIEPSELQEACERESSADALQATAAVPDTDPTPPVSPPAISPNTAQPATPSAPTRTQQRSNQGAAPVKTGRGKRMTYYVAGALVVLVGLAILAPNIPTWIQRITTSSVTITGTVFCADNERVVGVWVSGLHGSSGFAGKYQTNVNGSEVKFTYHLTYDRGYAGAYNLHVGCGGSIDDWEHITRTESGSGVVKDHAPHYFTCQDLPLVIGAGPCWLKS